MLHSRLYYRLKPFLPRAVRLGVRRWFAVRKRQRVSDVWPILPGSETPPAGWPGWPEGKQFAFVLTHDVEGPEGLAKVRPLAELEMKLGFRSSFNFIPEGTYRVPDDLRQWLVNHGFEVGVHDLYHDGRLFSSRAKFLERAAAINCYLKEWGAVGFRAGFMLNQIDWIHHLDIQYDASTFDTDPFEPQPKGQNTIFPFWIPTPDREKSEVRSQRAGTSASGSQPSAFSFQHSGFVELPYTLPQDSTLFLMFREQTPDIWFRKLDWIAKHGGMVLVDVHPDYVRLAGQSATGLTYPVEMYAELLQCVAAHYGGRFWHGLPRDVAAHVHKRPKEDRQTLDNAPVFSSEKTLANAPRRLDSVAEAVATAGPIILAGGTSKPLGPRVLMLVENNFPQDTRVKNEAFLLRSAGYRVSVLCYRKASQLPRETINGIDVYRMPRIELFQKTPAAQSAALERLILRLKSFAGYSLEYAYFTGMCFLGAIRVFAKSGFEVIHVHNPPDTLFLVGLPFKLLGKKFVFDHHDLSPELYQSRYGARRGFYTALLTLFEWCSLKLADVTIATNETYKEKQIERAGKLPERIFVVRNGPAEDRMRIRTPSPRLREMGKTILCYIGSVNPQDGVDYLLRSLRHLRFDLKRDDFHCVIMGTGDSLEDLRAQADALKLDGSVELTGFVSDQELGENLAAADICVDPDPSSPLNDASTWIKIMEYMACGKPIVSFDLKETRYSAQDAALFVPPNDEHAFARAIVCLMDDPDLRRKLGDFGRQRVERDLQWSVTGRNLLAAYRCLFPKA